MGLSRVGGSTSSGGVVSDITPTWTTEGNNGYAAMAVLPTMLTNVRAASIGNTIYVSGGRSAPSGAASAGLYAYDIATNTWTTKTAMPAAKENHSMDAVGGKLYVAHQTGVYVYDPVGNSWTSRTVTNYQGRTSQISCVLDNKIYLFGGTSSYVEIYDPSSNMVDYITPEAAPVSTFTQGGLAWTDGRPVFLGINSSVIYIYDFGTKNWRQRGIVNISGTATRQCVLVGDSLYFPGNQNYNSYNPVTHAYATSVGGANDTLHTQTSAENIVVGKYVYKIGGTVDNYSGTTKVTRFYPTASWANPLLTLSKTEQIVSEDYRKIRNADIVGQTIGGVSGDQIYLSKGYVDAAPIRLIRG